jgi:hypothetical protein
MAYVNRKLLARFHMPYDASQRSESHIGRIEETSNLAVPSKSLRDNDLGQFQNSMRTNRQSGLLIGGWSE